MQLLSADGTMFLNFFAHENMKKRPQKLLIIGPQLFLFNVLAAQTAQEQKSRTTKSSLIQDWYLDWGRDIFLNGLKTQHGLVHE